MIITEGVETEEQVDNLTKLGCDVFQGIIFLKLLMLTSLKKRDIYIGKKLGEYNYKTYIILELHR